MKQKIIALLLTFTAFLTLGSRLVQAAEKATPVKSKYVISSDSSFAPFVFQDKNNQYTGIDMDLIKAIAKDQGFTITINNPGFDVALNDVQSGHADGISLYHPYLGRDFLLQPSRLYRFCRFGAWGRCPAFSWNPARCCLLCVLWPLASVQVACACVCPRPAFKIGRAHV